MKQKAVRHYGDYLRENGIRYLTSESCAIGLRGLYDVDPDIVAAIESFFGVTLNARGWNNQDGKSIMLSNTVLKDLCIFLLLYNGCDIVAEITGDNPHVRGYWDVEYTDDVWRDEAQRINKFCGGKWRTYDAGTAIVRDLRNVHMFTGRAA